MKRKDAECYTPCRNTCMERAARRGKKLTRAKRNAMANRCFRDCMTTGCTEFLWYRED